MGGVASAVGSLVGGLFSGKPLVNTDVMVRQLIDVGLNSDVAVDIGNALSNLDFKLFEELTLDVLSNNKIDPNVKIKLLEGLDFFNNNEIFKVVVNMQSDPFMTACTVFPLLLVTLGVIFKDGVPLSVMIAVFFFVSIAVMLGGYLHHTANNVKKAKQKLLNADSVGPVPREMQITKHMPSNQVHILQKARTGPKVSHEIVQTVHQIEALGLMHGVATETGHIVAALQTQFENSNIPQSDIQADIPKVKTSLKALLASSNRLAGVTTEQSEQLCSTASSAKRWKNTLAGLIKSVQTALETIPKRPDFLLTTAEQSKKGRMLEKLTDRVVGKMKTILAEVQTPKASKTISADETRELSQELIRSLAFTPSLAKAAREQVEVAIENREAARAKLLAKDQELIEQKTTLSRMKKEIEIRDKAWRAKITANDYKIANQQQVVQELGQGGWEMTGDPPRGDDPAKRLHQLWQAGSFGKLQPYSVTSSTGKIIFEIKRTSKMSASQKEADDVMKALTKERDALIEAQKGSEFEKLMIAKDTLANRIASLEDQVAELQKSFDETDIKGKSGWDGFRQNYPNEYANIELAYKVDHVVLKAVEWISYVSTDKEVFENECEEIIELCEEDFEDPHLLLMRLKAAAEILEDPDVHTPALLRNIGDRELRQMTRPVVSLDQLLGDGTLQGSPQSNAKRALENEATEVD